MPELPPPPPPPPAPSEGHGRPRQCRCGQMYSEYLGHLCIQLPPSESELRQVSELMERIGRWDDNFDDSEVVSFPELWICD